MRTCNVETSSMQYNVALPHLGDRDAGNVHRVVDNGRRETFEQANRRGFDIQVQDVERRGVDGLQNARSKARLNLT